MVCSNAARFAAISCGDFAPMTRLVTAGCASGNHNAATGNGTSWRAQIASIRPTRSRICGDAAPY